MKNLLVIFLIFLLSGCKKENVEILPSAIDNAVTLDTPVYKTYNILKGTNFCKESTVKLFNGAGINFKVKFTNAAIYQTTADYNQGDVNKLYGFSEGIDNHINSARIGWNWQHNALRLYAYVYAGGVRNCKEISKVSIGEDIICSIRISTNKYLFSVDKKELELPRLLHTNTVAGYWQYPYFGGDEVAPHAISIDIMDLKN